MKILKKATITISFDEEKTTATRLYMKQKNVKLEEELVKAMEVLYTKSVPAGVRDFIEMRSGTVLETVGVKNTGRKDG